MTPVTAFPEMGRVRYPREENASVHAGLSLPGGEQAVTKLVVTYMLLPALLLFAVHGGFSFQHGSWNSDMGAVGGTVAFASTAAETLRERLQAWGALVLCMLAMSPHLRSIVSVSLRMPLMLALPLFAMLSSLWSQDALLSLRSGLYLLISTFFAFYLAIRFSYRQQMELALVTGTCVALLSFATVVFFPQFGLDHQLHEGAWQGLFTQKNVCAEAMLFLLTPALAMPTRGRYGQMLRILYILLCLALIFMTQSRTGWAVTLLYIAFISSLRVLGRLHRKALLPIASLIFAAAAALILAVMEYPSLILSLVSRTDSFSGRSQIWSAVEESILRHPIGGYGFDAFWSLLHGEASRVFAATGWVVTSAHNGFLNVGLELGVVGVALVGITFVQALRHANAAFRPGRSSYVDWCIGIVFLTLVYNLDERTLMATQYLPWIFYIVACTGLARAARIAGDGREVAASREELS